MQFNYLNRTPPPPPHIFSTPRGGKEDESDRKRKGQRLKEGGELMKLRRGGKPSFLFNLVQALMVIKPDESQGWSRLNPADTTKTQKKRRACEAEALFFLLRGKPHNSILFWPPQSMRFAGFVTSQTQIRQKLSILSILISAVPSNWVAQRCVQISKEAQESGLKSNVWLRSLKTSCYEQSCKNVVEKELLNHIFVVFLPKTCQSFT